MSPPKRTRLLPSRTRRAIAGSLDLVVGAGGALLLVAVGAIDVGRWFVLDPSLPRLETVAVEFYATQGETLWDWIALWLPFVVYHTAAGALRRSTLGAFLASLVVVGADGHLATARRGAARGILYFLWPLTGLLAAMWSFVSPSQRGLHDLLAGCWVVRDPARRRTPSP